MGVHCERPFWPIDEVQDNSGVRTTTDLRNANKLLVSNLGFTRPRRLLSAALPLPLPSAPLHGLPATDGGGAEALKIYSHPPASEERGRDRRAARAQLKGIRVNFPYCITWKCNIAFQVLFNISNWGASICRIGENEHR